MSCPETRKAYLYLSKELASGDREQFKKHLKVCLQCEEEVATVRRLKKTVPMEDTPSKEIRIAIMQEARNTAEKSSLPEIFRKWTGRAVWAVPVMATALVLILVNPLRWVGQQDQDSLLWQDDFFSQTYEIKTDLDALQEPVLLTSDLLDENIEDPISGLSTLTQDFQWIREQIEELMQTIYGI